MPSRFTQYGGAKGADDALKELVLQRIAAQLQAEQIAQSRYKLGQTDRGLDLEQEQINLAKQPKPQGPVTLTPGARLVTPSDGRTIAEAPMRPDPPERPMNLAPGGRLIMPSTGEVVASAPDRPQAQGSPDAGWSIQQVSDPKTNTTKLMRVNSRTGQAEPVNLPEGLQPGGQRQARLTAGQQDELATMKTVEDMADQAQALGDRIGWKGVGGLGSGSVSKFLAKNLGMGTEDEEGLRNYIGNIQGTIAKLRGGTSFTANEQKLLESYTPTINDGDMVLKAKIKSLKQFIATKRKNTLQFAGADMGAEGQPPADGSNIVKWTRDANGRPVRGAVNADH